MRSLIPLFLCLLSSLSGQSWISYQDDASFFKDKPTLLFFTDSEKDASGKRLENEVLESDLFLSSIHDSLHCVKVDLSSKESKQVEAASKLMNTYEAHSIPAFVLLDEQNCVIKRFSQLSISSSQFADDLLFALAQNRDLKNLFSKMRDGSISKNESVMCFELAQELGNQDVMHEMMRYGATHEVTEDLVVKLLRLAFNSKQEHLIHPLKEKAFESADLSVIEQVALLEYQYLNLKFPNSSKAAAPLEEFMRRHPSHDGWKIQLVLSQHYLEMDQWDRAQQLAENAKKSAPEDKLSEIQHTISYIRGLQELASK